MTVPAGTRLGVYEVLSAIGTGGMGEIYRARDTRLDRIVAIKVLRGDISLKPETQQRFEREARLISSLNHPHICMLFDVGNHEGVEYLVMEYLQGESLAECLQRERVLPLQKALGIAIDVADALDKAHRQGIIHRDLKPGNIMLSDAGTKLLDFGLAKGVEGAEFDIRQVGQTQSDLMETEEGLILGTYYYMSPEQARGFPSDARTDIWSLGVLLFRMTSGQLPFDGPTPNDAISLILLKDPPISVLHSRGLPERLCDIITKMLAKERDERYQTARDLLLDLKQLSHRIELKSELERSGGVTTDSGLYTRAHANVPDIVSSPASPTSAIAETASSIASRSNLHEPQLLAVIALLLAAVVAASFSQFYVLGLLVFAAATLAGYRLLVRKDSIAVLPFTYVTTDSALVSDPDKEYLADGITESIINSISQFSSLRVISRSSVFRYKGQNAEPHIVAKELGIRNVLSGRIVQRGTKFLISVEIEDALQRKHLWGEQYEREMSDLVRLPREIASEISTNLRASWTRGTVNTKNYPENSKAYQSYLKGRFFWNKRTAEDLEKAIEHFQSAIEADPSYALAYVGVADCYIVLSLHGSKLLPKDAYAKAKEAANKALQRDSKLAEAHASMAVIKAGMDWDLQGALKEFAESVKLNPNYATARQWYAEHLVCARRDRAAILHIKRAQQLDPLSAITTAVMGQILWQAGRNDEAIAELSKAVEIDRSLHFSHRLLRDVYLEKEMFHEALEEDRMAITLAGESPEQAEARANALNKAYLKSGWEGYWLKRIEMAEAKADQESSLPYDLADTSPYHRAGLYARAGQREMAIKLLQEAFDERDYGVFYLKTNRAFDHLQSDPQLAKIIDRIGLTN